MKILVGVHGYDPKSTSTFFNYCKNENELNTRLNKQDKITKKGIIFYFKINGSDVISRKNLEHILAYLKSIVD